MTSDDTLISAVTSSIDLDAEGKQHGHISFPYSQNDSAWGSVRLPICVIANGSGPTVTLLAGSHGDEYEGPIALLNLARQLQASEISGRLILIPCLNAPAVAAATRLSPLDNLNMNREFPGKRRGTPTQMIADYITTEVISRSDIVLDIHSGGKSLDFTPFAAVHFLDDREQQKKAEEIMIAFGAPNSLRMRELDNRGMLDTLVESQGRIFVTTELGGGGGATRQSIQLASVGCRNVLAHSGLLNEEVTLCATRMLEIPEENSFIVAESQGLLEMCTDLGEPVYQGSVFARVLDPMNSGQDAHEYVARRDGILLAKHFPGMIRQGDCLAVIAEEVQR